MLCPYDVGLVELRFQVGDLEHLLGLLGQRNVADGERSAGGPDSIFDRLFQLVEVDTEIAQDLDGNSFTYPNDAKEQVFRTDVIVT